MRTGKISSFLKTVFSSRSDVEVRADDAIESNSSVGSEIVAKVAKRSRKLTTVAATAAVILGASSLGVVGAQSAGAATDFSSACGAAGGVLNQNVCTFNYSGATKTITLDTGNYKLEAYGAQGGSSASINGMQPNGDGGFGGVSTGTINVTSISNFNIVVGGAGVATSIKNSNALGGYGTAVANQNGGGGGSGYAEGTSSTWDRGGDGGMTRGISTYSAGGSGGGGSSISGAGVTVVGGGGGGGGGNNAKLHAGGRGGHGGGQAGINYAGNAGGASGGGGGGYYGGGGGGLNVMTGVLNGNSTLGGWVGNGLVRIAQITSPPSVSTSTATILNDSAPTGTLNWNPTTQERVRYSYTVANSDTTKGSFTGITPSATWTSGLTNCVWTTTTDTITAGGSSTFVAECDLPKSFYNSTTVGSTTLPALTASFTGTWNGVAGTVATGSANTLPVQTIYQKATLSETMGVGSATGSANVTIGAQVFVTTTVTNAGTSTITINASDLNYTLVGGTNRKVVSNQADTSKLVLAPGASGTFTLTFNADWNQTSTTAANPMTNTTTVNGSATYAGENYTSQNFGTTSSSKAITATTTGLSVKVTPESTSTGSWTQIPTAPTTRSENTATNDLQGRQYLIGGYINNTFTATSTQVDRYDPATNTWSQVAPLPQALRRATAATDKLGRIYVVGGISASGQNSSNIYRYDSSSDQWESLPSMSTGGNQIAVAIDKNNQIYALGGNGRQTSFSKFNPATNIWSEISMPPSYGGSGLYGASAVSDQNGDIYLIAGYSFSQSSNTNYVSKYSVSSGLWSSMTYIPSATQSPSSIFMNNKIYTHIGGASNGFYVYDTYLNSWSLLSSSLNSHYIFGSATDNFGRFYVLGSYGNTSSNIMERYTPGSAVNTTASYTYFNDKFANSKLEPGDQARVSFTVTNTGSSALSTPTFTGPTADWVITPEDSTTTIAAGGTKKYTAVYTAPATVKDETITPVFTATASLGSTCPSCSNVSSTGSVSLVTATTSKSITVGTPTATITTDNGTSGKVDLGDTVKTTVTITNNGLDNITNLSATSVKGTYTLDKTSLAPGEVATATFTRVATAADLSSGSYTEDININGKFSTDSQNFTQITKTVSVSAVTPSSGIQITSVVAKNGATTVPSGSAITSGTTLTFTYTVKNTGNIPLSTVGVTTNDNITVTCSATTLAAGVSTTCSGQKTF